MLWKILILSSFVGCFMEQKPCITGRDVLLTKDKPTVYITFEGIGKSKSANRLLTEKSVLEGQSSTNRNSELVWLRIHNNTRWVINVTVGAGNPPVARERLCDGRGIGAFIEGAEINLHYYAEALSPPETVYTVRTPNEPGDSSKSLSTQKPDVPFIRWPDMVADGWLMPGRSVIFPVQHEHLGKRLMIYVLFNYEWESNDPQILASEPQHRVYFRSIDLPQNLQ